MPRILDDPTQAVCPSFEGPEWEFLRQAIIDTYPGEIFLTAEEAARQMREAWTQDNDARVVVWNAELEKDRKTKEAQHARLEKEAEEQRRVLEKNKPKLNSFDPTRRASKWIEPRPAPHALEKINK